MLDYLREKVILALHQTGKKSEIQDGMDIALCCIDSINSTLKYAGAHRPLYIIRRNNDFENIQNSPDVQVVKKGDFTLLILKGDAQPISIFKKSKPFKSHGLPLLKGDKLYMFSDGIIDQFGGEHNAKFNLPNFQDLLFDVQNESFEKQKEVIEKIFYDWKKDLAQTDDVLIIGMEI